MPTGRARSCLFNAQEVQQVLRSLAVDLAPLVDALAAQLVSEQGDFDVVLMRKLCAPQQPELAVGAVDETGGTCLSPYAESYGADAAYLAEEKPRQMPTMAQRRAR